MPRKNLTATRPEKLVTLAVAADTQDQTKTQQERYRLGRTLVRIMLDGSCASM